MTTLAQLETRLAQDLRDAAHSTWSTTELDTFINQGIDELAAFYPREIVQTLGTISANVRSFDASAFTNIYRLDIYASTGTLRGTLVPSIGPVNSGWELHGNIVYLPPSIAFTTGDTLQAWGYGIYSQLSGSASTTDLNTSGINAVMAFAQAEALGKLISNRAAFQQWQVNANATDATMLGIAQAQSALRAGWDRERQRLRRMRKL